MEELFSETVSLSSLGPNSEKPKQEEPKTIGSGVVTAILGKGGAAVIYEIWNPKLEIHRAVKLWRPTLVEKNIQRFETEMKITAKLRHPNIVEIHAVGEWNNLPFIEIEKIEGDSLKDLLRKKGGLPVSVAAAIGIFISRALAYAHNHEYTLGDKKYKGVIHCDIKPANIMISNTGVVKLTDFGIALPTHSAGNADKNTITGSLQYMAPEQLSSGEIDVRTDIFSLGTVLYELFSGTKAFSAQSIEALIEKRRNHEFIPIRECEPKLPPKVIALIEKCLEVTPDDRIQSVQEVMAELENIFSGYTKENPESLLGRFLNDDVISTKPLANKKMKLVFIGVLSITALVLIMFLPAVFKKHSSDTNTTIKTVQQMGTPSSTQLKELNRNPLPPIETAPSPVITQKVIENQLKGKLVKGDLSKKQKNTLPLKKASPVRKNLPVTADVLPATQVKADVKKDAESVSEVEIIDELWRLVKSSEYKNAERMFAEFPINDAEYFLVYSEFLLKKGSFEQARISADKALQKSSKRMDPSEVRSRCFYLKAKALSGNFDKNPDSLKAQKAMEAWFDVKFQSRSNVNSSFYIDADKEIRRISAQMQH
jgi:serine/threonine protein kinase